ncbi:MAG: UDP-N-acetylmuramoyl-tripeptide--D-alanyl-D-alanine ligase [Proteobacteria bacterium]|nr:UDP-N-acetylmuramoyl-tripeptide--D-alanyl-D-alanine ligase [Pseudomonadota bacterium]NOG60086.1 UDP-N-acetylmuramoyl-tripeptide--D-alanyl-D-alanine ligase [Pseudomonadota bacterium]
MSLSKAATAINASFVGDDIIFSGCSTDSRTITHGNLFIALTGENFDGHDYVSIAEENGASSVMLEKEVSHTKPLLQVEDTRKAMGLLARTWRDELSIPLVAITGSNGKTTVKEMVSSILSEVSEVHATTGNLNNEIGVPLTLFGLDKKHQYAVIEMGANHPGEIEWLSAIARPNVAVITQCAPSHLEGFGSVEGVAKAKAEIYSGLQSSGTAIINADDEYAEFWKEVCLKQEQLTFGMSSDANVRAVGIEVSSQDATVSFSLKINNNGIDIHLPLSGIHNVMNALAAAACCYSLDVSLETIKSGLEKMGPVKGRLQVKNGKNSARIIDDTYNANPRSLDAALDVLSAYNGPRYLVLGDMGELGNSAIDHHVKAGQLAKDANIDGLYSIGELSVNAMQSYGEGAFHFDSYDALEKSLLEVLDDKTTVLVKGSRFMKMEQVVNALIEEKE